MLDLQAYLWTHSCPLAYLSILIVCSFVGRKIGCDKTIPTCNNCIRTKRVCDGYGIKLQWPESGDGRRPAQEWDTYRSAAIASRPRSGGYHFLNTTGLDLRHDKNGLLWENVFVQHSMSPPRSLPYGFEKNLRPREETLISYCRSL